MPTYLYQLLNENESKKIKIRIKIYPELYMILQQEVKDLTLKQITEISLTIVASEYNMQIPECNLLTETILILWKRAKEKDLGIF